MNRATCGGVRMSWTVSSQTKETDGELSVPCCQSDHCGRSRRILKVCFFQMTHIHMDLDLLIVGTAYDFWSKGLLLPYLKKTWYTRVFLSRKKNYLDDKIVYVVIYLLILMSGLVLGVQENKRFETCGHDTTWVYFRCTVVH